LENVGVVELLGIVEEVHAQEHS